MAEQTSALTVWRTEHVRNQLVEPTVHTGSCPLFATSSVARLHRIVRLRHDLGVNLAAVAVILEMLEQIENLQTDLKMLRERSGQQEQ
jgi:DNA-binding transcriptional MerR regulator